jgi:type IV pilus assembly protein PilW
MKKTTNKNNGFSLVEIMVSMVIAGLVMAGIYGVYTIQQRTYTVQEQVSEMQQKGRAALDFMIREIRMAAYDPPTSDDPLGKCDGAEILTAAADNFVFEYCDVQQSPVDKEKSTYLMYDTDGDGLKDALYLQHGDAASTKRALAEGVDGLEFLYFGEDPTSSLGTSVASADLDNIRSVKISMLVRATYPDPKYTDTILHEPASILEKPSLPHWTLTGEAASNPPNDHYHRRLLITTVKMRNMGLQ